MRRAVVVRPTGMDAGVTADQRPIVHGEPVRVGGAWSEVDGLQHPAGSGIVLDQTGPAFGIVLTVVAGDLPDGAVVPCRGMVTIPARSLIERDQEFRQPRAGIHAKNPPQPER